MDSLFAIHHDMGGQSGSMMTLGKGAVISGSVKQRINCKISTNTEVVSVNDYMLKILWCGYFINWQGYKMQTVLYPDNMSAEFLETNGRKSMRTRSRHMNIRYFFITDRVKSGLLLIEHCGTDDMNPDFFTKPVQGEKFNKFWAAIMNKNIG